MEERITRAAFVTAPLHRANGQVWTSMLYIRTYVSSDMSSVHIAMTPRHC